MGVLDTLVDAYLAEHFAESPVAASDQGWPDRDDDKLPDLSAAGFARRAAAADRWFAKFSAVGDDQLTPAECIDRDLVLSHLRGEQIMRDWAVWRRQPDQYLAAGLTGVFSLLLRRLRPEPELAATAAARFDAVPRVLDEARQNLDPELVSADLARRAIGQCRAGAAYTRDMAPTEVAEENRAALAAAGARAAAAYESFGAFLADLADRATGDHAIGDARYSALLKEKEGLPFDRPGLQAKGRAEYDAIDQEMRALSKQISGDDDWHATLATIQADAPATPEAMRAAYEEWTERARAFLREHELVSFPDGERCDVVPSPIYQRPMLAVASYTGPPAFASSLVGRFNVPYPPEGTSPEDLAKRLSDNNFGSIPTVSVHEAYPGHHWHYAIKHDVTSPLRLVFGTPYFVEGWALYAEHMMREQGFFTDPRAEFCHLDARIFRAARIVVDTSLHAGEMTVDEAIDFMSTKASLSAPVARAEVLRYCAWPTQASSYLTGCLEIQNIRERYFAAGGSLRTFHDKLASSGSLPLALAERALHL